MAAQRLLMPSHRAARSSGWGAPAARGVPCRRRATASAAASEGGGEDDAELAAMLASWRAMDAQEGNLEAEDLDAVLGDADELRARLCSRLAFGTAGLRGLAGAGFSRMNAVVVAQTTQGLATYAEEAYGAKKAQDRGVVIGFDARENSDHFAKVAAGVFASRGWNVELMSDLCPTPLLASAVSQRDRAVGVMVTASHNPREYNGYKVYWGNGCQIVPPHDAGIAAAIEANLALWERPAASYVELLPNVRDGLKETAESYYEDLVAGLHFRGGDGGVAAPIAAYTPLHGVGGPWAERALEAFGLPPAVPVPLQMQPDATFPTVTFPNPEEGAETWALAFDAAAEAGVPVVLANDPDADRLAAAEWDESAKAFVPFTGNEIGALLAHWVWSEYKARNPGVDPSRMALLASTVSSKMLRGIADAEGLQFHETLTGFKWLGNKARDLQSEGVTALFAFEEAIGFAFPAALTPDKDGIAAVAVFTEMAVALRERGLTVRKQLNKLYEMYGAYQHRQGYEVADPAANRLVFERLRANYAHSIGGRAVERIRDMGAGLDGMPGQCADGSAPEPSLPWAKGELMISYYLEGGDEVTLRASGTEPKLKWYLEARRSTPEEAADAAETLRQAVRAELLIES